jgi:hypothetical protein
MSNAVLETLVCAVVLVQAAVLLWVLSAGARCGRCWSST